MGDVSTLLTCPCRPNFTYKNLAQHKKTKLHQAWENSKELKDTRVQSKQFENEVERLKRRLEHKEKVEVELLNRIRQLELEIQYLKTSYNGVYL